MRSKLNKLSKFFLSSVFNTSDQGRQAASRYPGDLVDDSKRPRRTLLQQLFVKILFDRLADYSEKEAAIVGTAKVIREPIIGGRVSESSISIVQRTVAFHVARFLRNESATASKEEVTRSAAA